MQWSFCRLATPPFCTGHLEWSRQASRTKKLSQRALDSRFQLTTHSPQARAIFLVRASWMNKGRKQLLLHFYSNDHDSFWHNSTPKLWSKSCYPFSVFMLQRIAGTSRIRTALCILFRHGDSILKAPSLAEAWGFQAILPDNSC